MAIEDITKPMALDETLQDTNTALGLLGKDTTLQAIVTALGNIGINTVGNLASLVTTDKSSLVGAVNELAGDIDDLDTDKANKVSSATAGNLAGLDSNGDLTDANWSADKTTQSATGNPISISGLKSNQLAKNPIITFEPIQAGSGTPSPSNIRAISGYDKIEVLSCGKNIFNGEVIQGRWSHTDGTWVEQATFWATKNPIPVIGGQSNYISNVVYRAYYDKNMTFISGDGTGNAVATTPANAVWMHITQAKADWSSPSTTMVAISNTAIDYVPYHKTTDLSESLGQTVYWGRYLPRTGEFEVLGGSVDLGTLTWQNDTTTRPADGATIHAHFATLADCKVVDNFAVGNMYCAIYQASAMAYVDYGGMTVVMDAIIGGADGNHRIWIYDSRYNDTSAADFKTAMSGIMLIYELATPFTIQLTPHEISLLKDYAYVSTNGTNIALDYHNGELASLGDVSQLGETVNELGDKVSVKFKTVTDTTSSVGNFDPAVSTDNVIIGVACLSHEYIGIPFRNTNGAWRCRFLDLTNIGYIKNTSITAKIYYI